MNMQEQRGYLRPETAGDVRSVRYQAVDGDEDPVRNRQTGKSFRNEITTERFIFRSCAFGQMEMEFSVSGQEWFGSGRTTA